MAPKIVLVLSVASALLIAGCGGGSGSSAPPDSAASPSASPSVPPPGKTDDKTKGDPGKKDQTGTPNPTKHKKKNRPSTKSATPSAKTTKAPIASGGGMSAVELKVVRLVNARRATAGCKALRTDARLARAARSHSKDMAVHHYFSHTSQDGRSPWDRIKAQGYADPGAENIAAGYPTAEAVMKGWMNSSGHRANILNCALKAIGVGEYGHYWTQDFGFH